MITTFLTALVTSIITGLVTFSIQERKLRAELRTQFMVERAVKTLFENDRWKKRSFDEIEKRLGGFEKDELRKILVRSGAIRFEGTDGKELWGLMSRNSEEL